MVFDSGMLRLEALSEPRAILKVIDRLFISVADEQQERAICIVLTGADHDGTTGLKAIKAAGGMVMAQLPETAQHPSMPESAIDTGLVDYVLPIEGMGQALAEDIDRAGLWQRDEEALSMNEELQSANEELETSKEELQSVNEELNSVNSDLEQAVTQLQTANDDLANLLASSELPILFLDRELAIKRFTPASRKLFSIIPSDIGRPISDLASRLESQDIVDVAREVQRSRSIRETEVCTRDGHFYLRRVLPYLIEDHVEGAVISLTPIDAIKQAENELRESEKRFRTLADSAPVFIWISGLGAALEFVNRRFINDTGQGAEGLLGTKWHGFVHQADLAGYLAACSNAEVAGRGYDQELRLQKADGTYGWMRFVGEPRWDGQRLVGFVGSSVDIQYHKDAEDKLRKADKRKDEFLATLGHEIRNPLSPIRNAAQTLQLIGSEDPRLVWARETISRRVDHITRLVDDLLDISRLTSGKLTLQQETVNMADIVRQSVDSTKALVDERKHQLVIEIRDEPLFVRGDGVRLIQIIENLLTNATKFTAPGGKISLNVHREGQEVVISVEDNGMSISEHMLSRIFELFAQEERAVRASALVLPWYFSSYPCMAALSRRRARDLARAADSKCAFRWPIPGRRRDRGDTQTRPQRQRAKSAKSAKSAFW